MVQDLFLTETAVYADVVLPASAWPEKDGTVTNTNRQVQMGRTALPLPGEAKARLVDHAGDRQAYRHELELHAPERDLHRDGLADALAQQHLLGAGGARERRHLSVRCARCARPRRRVRQGLPAPRRLRQTGGGQAHAARRDARPRIPVHPHHRAHAGTLAHRRHDAARNGARRARAGADRGALARHLCQARHQAGRHGARCRPGAARSNSPRARTTPFPTAWCSSPSPSSRRRPTSSPTRRSIRSARSPSSSSAPRGWRRSSRSEEAAE